MAQVANSNLLTSGIPTIADACVVIVKTEWNHAIVEALYQGALSVLQKVGNVAIVTINVPGAVEISFAIQNYFAKSKEKQVPPDAFIALGCVIQGDTPHFTYVCNMVSHGISQLNLQLPVPSIFGILTVNNEEQAWDRLGGIHGHKGEEAAITALKMIKIARGN